ncbi:MAG: GIY-YIG nuclease family protein [Methanosarcinaceae archaeon]|jgi:hypothetical protein|nr:GIY-YIG nuclease family protein [Methanosarcinaceae archaeon]
MARQVKKASTQKRVKKKTSKGALIKGVSAKLPIEILNEPSFKLGVQEIMKGYSGIYLLYRHTTLFYIGLATNLYGRLISHTRDKLKGKWDSFAIFRVGRVRYLKDIETLLLRVARPPGNSVKGHFHRDGDLTRVIKKIQLDQVRRFTRIKKALGR